MHWEQSWADFSLTVKMIFFLQILIMLEQKMPEIILTNHAYDSSPVPKSRLYHSLIYESPMTLVII